MTPTPGQLAQVLTKAANHRVDVRRALFSPDPQYPEQIVGELYLENGDTRTIETTVARVMDGQRTTGRILEDWIGEEVTDIARGMRPSPWHDEHALLLWTLPTELLRLVEAGETELELPDQPPPATFPYQADPDQPVRGPRRPNDP